MSKNYQIKEWHPIKYLHNNEQNISKNENYAIVILNRPINVTLFSKLWNNATIRQCVDGGLNQFIEYKKERMEFLKAPYLITGDFDSCSSISMEYAKLKKCKIVKTLDQNETDFTKALRALAPELEHTITNSVLVICESSGRLDQIMANINTLFKAQEFWKNTREIMLLASNSISFLLSPGKHMIHIPTDIIKSNHWCGLIPFKTTIVSTRGLKWNMHNTLLEFGTMVSTSNTYRNDIQYVEVKTDSPVLWTMGTDENTYL